jgi:two-component system, OmpR family, sensor kinase
MSRTSLRTRLVAGLLVLVALGLVVVNVAGVTLMRRYLVNQVDQQLVAAASRPPREALHAADPGGPPSNYVYTWLDRQGNVKLVVRGSLLDGRSAPDVAGITDAQIARRAGRPFTVNATNGDDRYRAIAVSGAQAGFVDTSTGAPVNLVTSVTLRPVDSTVHRLAIVGGAVSLGVLVLMGLLALLVVDLGLRPLEDVEATAAAIAAGDLSRRVPEAPRGTEIGRLSRALNGMLAQIERAFAERETSEQRLRRFVADASHELRTPLTSIRGYAELYRQGAVPDPVDQRRLMGRIEGEAARMGRLVDDLLLLARLDQQRPLERGPVDLAVLATDAVADAQASDPSRPIDLAFHDDTGSLVVTGDEHRLRQVLGNLVGNAVMHTPVGTPVHVRLERGADGRAEVVVADEGQGMPAEQASRVFERFYRADPSRSRAAGGSGLGLSIVQALVQAHGGSVTCDSTPGQGTTFTVRLPVQASPDRVPA